jgi:hypothetical protein
LIFWNWKRLQRLKIGRFPLARHARRRGDRYRENEIILREFENCFFKSQKTVLDSTGQPNIFTTSATHSVCVASLLDALANEPTDARIILIMTAQEFVNSIQFPCFFYAGNGAPAGITYAILEDTALPVDLEDVEGEVDEGGVFNCTNHDDGQGGWNHSDHQGNTIYKIQIFSDKARWEREYSEWMGIEIEDGVYFLHPEGSAWIAAEFRGGKLVDQTSESNAGSHNAAGDAWAGVEPSEYDEETEGDVAAAIVRAVMGEGTDADCVVVTTSADPDLVDCIKSVMARGPMFSGNDASGIAAEWLEEMPDSYDDWMEVGFWEPSTARRCSDAGYSSADMLRIEQEQVEAGIEYASGGLIYALCNNDASAEDIKRLESIYNVFNAGGEVLNLDGPVSFEEANNLAKEIEDEHGIEVKVKIAE